MRENFLFYSYNIVWMESFCFYRFCVYDGAKMVTSACVLDLFCFTYQQNSGKFNFQWTNIPVTSWLSLNHCFFDHSLSKKKQTDAAKDHWRKVMQLQDPIWAPLAQNELTLVDSNRSPKNK